MNLQSKGNGKLFTEFEVRVYVDNIVLNKSSVKITKERLSLSEVVVKLVLSSKACWKTGSKTRMSSKIILALVASEEATSLMFWFFFAPSDSVWLSKCFSSSNLANLASFSWIC